MLQPDENKFFIEDGAGFMILGGVEEKGLPEGSPFSSIKTFVFGF